MHRVTGLGQTSLASLSQGRELLVLYRPTLNIVIEINTDSTPESYNQKMLNGVYPLNIIVDMSAMFGFVTPS